MLTPLKLYMCLGHGLKMCILLDYNPQNIFAVKMIRYKVSGVLSCFLIAHMFKEKHKVTGDKHSLNLLVFTESSHVSYQIKDNGA